MFHLIEVLKFICVEIPLDPPHISRWLEHMNGMNEVQCRTPELS
jgi:hypothetical protein